MLDFAVKDWQGKTHEWHGESSARLIAVFEISELSVSNAGDHSMPI
jgi:hypothetical protein